MRYRVALQESEEGFSVRVPGLPGCVSQGTTEEEALANIANAASIAPFAKREVATIVPRTALKR